VALVLVVIIEMKNLHLEHPEDTIFTGDLSILNWLSADSKISIKMDGSPAIVWGTNPATGKFFVGTKSVFNKVKIKINHSHEEIDANHEGKVADVLHVAFDCLPRISGIIQGDFLGFGGSDTYSPNTITYKFPQIITQDILVAPHTCYDAEYDLRDAVAHTLDQQLKTTESVKWIQPKAYLKPHREDIEDVCKFAKQMAMTCTFVSVKESNEIKKQINHHIRNQEEIVEENFSCDSNLIRLWKLIESIKLDLMECFILCDDSVQCMIGNESVSHEGYVMTNDCGMHKLVNRRIFSYYNFVLPKNWS
jgi:hypothetical protein